MRPKANPGTDGGGGGRRRRPRRTAWCASILLVVTTLVTLNTVGVILRSAVERETTDQTYRRQMMARFYRDDPVELQHGDEESEREVELAAARPWIDPEVSRGSYESLIRMALTHNTALCAGVSVELDILPATLEIARSSELLGHAVKHSRRIYVAGMLKAADCKLVIRYAIELVRFAAMYTARSGEVFVAILESGGNKCTRDALALLRKALTTLGVASDIRIGEPLNDGKGTRVDKLQFLRNAVLSRAPLVNYDEIVFLNDVYFCAADIVRLLRHSGASIKCGLDFDLVDRSPKFYDTWVAKDINGNAFTKHFPYARDTEGDIALRERRAFQAKCCWNGLAVLKTGAFIEGVRFRRSLTQDECHASECEIICHDFAAMGHPRVLVDPEVTVVYDSKTLAALKVHRMFGQTNLRDDTLLTVPTVERWNVTSACTHCVPLDGHRRRDPDFSKQSIFNWEEMFYHRGVPLGRVYSMGSLTSCANASVASCITNNNNFLGFARSMRRPRSCHATQVGI